MEKSKCIWIIYGGNGVGGQFGFGKMYWKLVFISCFKHFFWVNSEAWNYARIHFVTFRKSVTPFPLAKLKRKCRKKKFQQFVQLITLYKAIWTDWLHISWLMQNLWFLLTMWYDSAAFNANTITKVSEAFKFNILHSILVKCLQNFTILQI